MSILSRILQRKPTRYFLILISGIHRCPLTISKDETTRVFKGDENEYLQSEIDEYNKSKKKHAKEKKQYELWVWDIESHFVLTDEPTDQTEYDIETGEFVLADNTPILVKKATRLAQLGNYVYCKNVFTDTEYEFNSLEAFIDFTQTNNEGYNYFLAHNSSGYDSRLLFEVVCTKLKTEPSPLMKGSKFMRMEVGNSIFQDTLFHLNNSLKNLGKAYGLPTEKGYFPHLFSTLENLDYEGPLPAKEYFDLAFTCKTEQDFIDFNKWHDEYNGTWNYLYQRKLYCRNDVIMLQQIVKIYHDEMINSLKQSYPYLTISPWFFPTMAGYVHKLQLRHLHEGHYIDTMTPEQLVEYSKTTWVALEPEEHYFAKKALRGGMTNICKYIADGPIHYQDIQSAYPSVQMDVENLYPVGAPIIEIYDQEHLPCGFCYALEKCTHSIEQIKLNRENHKHKKVNIVYPTVPSNLDQFFENFFGIATVDVTPPRDLYHPLIQDYDSKAKRVIGTLNPIKAITLPSNIINEAIKNGYIITKLYRADRYVAAESKFRNGLLGDMYVAKMKNSKPIPESEHSRMKETFLSKFNIDLGDMTLYKKNPVKKQVAKGPVTAAWGKHAESVDHDCSKVISYESNNGMNFYETLLWNKSELTNVRIVGNNTMFSYKENRVYNRPDTHRGYLPLAVFVTAYGRIKLWRQLIKIDPRGTPRKDLRVLMYDTDSIVYLRNPSNYIIPEGDCLGDWETEDMEKEHGGIIGFRAIAPKSYAIICNDGYVSMKLKGAVLKYAHRNMMTHETMEQLVKSKQTNDHLVVKLPQLNFVYKMGHKNYMTTHHSIKVIQFNENDVKGNFSWDDYRGYPFGFWEK